MIPPAALNELLLKHTHEIKLSSPSPDRIFLIRDGQHTQIGTALEFKVSDVDGADITHRVKNFSTTEHGGKVHYEIELNKPGYDGPFCIAENVTFRRLTAS